MKIIRWIATAVLEVPVLTLGLIYFVPGCDTLFIHGKSVMPIVNPGAIVSSQPANTNFGPGEIILCQMQSLPAFSGHRVEAAGHNTGGSVPMPVPAPTSSADRTIEIDVPGSQTKVKVNPDGGLAEPYSQSFLNGSVILSFEAGTVINTDGGVPDRIVFEESAETPPLSTNTARVSPFYSITAYIGAMRQEHASFSRPFRFVVKYNKEALNPDPTEIFIAYYDGFRGWIRLDSPPGFIAGTGQVAAFVNHFSLFTVLATGEAPKPALIKLDNLTVMPEDTRPGDTVTIKARLVNSGDMPGEYAIKIKITDLLDTSRLVKIDPGKTDEITIKVAPAKTGVYYVEVGNLSGRFTVRTPTEEAAGLLYWFYLFIALIIVLIFLAAWVLIRRRRKQEDQA